MKRVVVTALFLVGSNMLFSQGSDEKIADGKVTIVEEMPAYPGGNDALLKYVSRELRYPQECRKNGLTGVVFVTFFVNESGAVDNAYVSFSSNSLFNDEAVRVIKSIRGYTPGKQQGKPVIVKFTMPISFILNDSEEDLRTVDQTVATGYYKIALDELAKNNDRSAIYFLGEAIARGNNWLYQAHATRGDLQLRSSNYQEALDDYSAAVGISDTLVSAWQGKGMALLAMNRLDEAASAFQSVLRLRPNAFDATFNLGLIRLTQKQFEEAHIIFSKAIEMDGSSGVSYYNRGMCSARLRNKEDACRDWLQAKSLGVKEAISVAESCGE